MTTHTIYEVMGKPLDKRMGKGFLIFQFNSLKGAKDVYYHLLDPRENRTIQREKTTRKILFSSFKGIPHLDNGKRIQPIKGAEK